MKSSIDQGQRPTFGGTAKPAAAATDKPKRDEAGAIWSRTTKNNTEFLSIKLKFSKDFLKKLTELNQEEVSVNYVAFPNDYKKDNQTRPDFKVYEEQKKD